MRRLWLPLMLLVVFSVGWVAARWSNLPESSGNPTTQRQQPLHECPLVVEPPVGYGEVYEEQAVIPYRFTIRNKGNTPVTIDKIRPSCQCTVIKVDANVVPAGGSVQFTAAYNVVHEFGRLSKRRILISTDHSACGQLSCEITGVRHQRFTIEPETVDFGMVTQGHPSKMRVKIAAHGADLRLVPRRMIATNVSLTADIVSHKKNADGEDVIHLDIGVPSDIPIGEIDGTLFIPRKEDDGIGPVVHFHAEIVGPVRVMPPVLFFGTVPDDQPRTRAAELIATNNKSRQRIRVLRFENLPDGVSGSVSVTRPDMINIVVDPATHKLAEDFDATITIVCDMAGSEHRLSVPISARFRSRQQANEKL